MEDMNFGRYGVMNFNKKSVIDIESSRAVLKGVEISPSYVEGM